MLQYLLLVVFQELRQVFPTQYDDAQSIGRRYRRQDEIGTPLCVTGDFQSVQEDNAVTIRNRDSMEQVRIPITELIPTIARELKDLGTALLDSPQSK